MNKRQTKKKEKNEMSLCGMTYREDRQMMREVREYEASKSHIKSINEDMKILVELGIYTWEEVAAKLYRAKQKSRWRQVKKVQHD